MTAVDIRRLFALAALAAAALLTACGGAADPGDPTAVTPALSLNAPVADCEADGCNRPRIVDGLAEQYRAAASEQPAALAGVTGEAAPQPAALAGFPSEAAPR